MMWSGRRKGADPTAAGRAGPITRTLGPATPMTPRRERGRSPPALFLIARLRVNSTIALTAAASVLGTSTQPGG